MSVANPGTPQASASTQAIASLVLGLASVLTCCGLPLAPIAWYLGNQELKAIAEGRAPAAGNGVAQAGKILGMVGTLLMAVALAWIFFMGGFVILQAWLSNHF